MRKTPWLSSSYVVDVKIKVVHVDDADFNAVLKVGWLGDDHAVFTRWRKATAGFAADWGRSLCQRLEPSHTCITLVLYQKVGKIAAPVAMRRIPCQQCFGSGRKHTFKLPFENVEGRGVEIEGYVRARAQEGVDISQPSSQLSTTKSKNLSRSRSWLVNELSLTDSQNKSQSATFRSVDLSIDLCNDVPEHFYPLITDEEVYANILQRHPLDISLPLSAVRYLLEIPGDSHHFFIPMDRQLPEAEGGGGFVQTFLSLGLILNVTDADSFNPYGKWIVDHRVCDLPSVQLSVRKLVEDSAYD